MIELKNLVCNFEIVLEKDGEEFKHIDEISYGPTTNKLFDFVHSPFAFLQNGVDLFDYENIKSISINITRE